MRVSRCRENGVCLVNKKEKKWVGFFFINQRRWSQSKRSEDVENYLEVGSQICIFRKCGIECCCEDA